MALYFPHTFRSLSVITIIFLFRILSLIEYLALCVSVITDRFLKQMATCEDWDDFSERKPNRNVALVVEGRSFWIPKDSLADYSPVFSNMFFGMFKEATKTQIPLPEEKSDDVLEMLRCLIRTGQRLKKVDDTKLVTLFKLADKYDIKFLEQRCHKRLEKLGESSDKIKTIFVEAIDSGVKDVVHSLLPKMARFTQKELDPIWNQIPDQVRSAILYQRDHHLSDHYGWVSCSCCTTTGPSLFQCAMYKSCHKPTAPGGYSSQYCQCIAPQAAAELEMID